MEHLVRAHDESDRLYQSLVDVSNASWPDPERTVLAIRERGKSVSVIRVLNIRIKLETRPAR
jgi:hypothetical protein